MGDRCVIHVKDSGVSTYLHWSGHRALELLKQAVPLMRASDPGYSQARLTGFLHTQIEGNTGLGVFEGPSALTPEALAEHSHGNAGVIVYDSETGKATLHAGYLETEHGPEVDVGIPPR